MGDSLSWLKHLLCTQKIKGSTPLSSTQDCLKFSQGIGLPQGLLNCLENSGDGWLMRITHGAVVTTANTVDLQSVNEGSIPFCSTNRLESPDKIHACSSVGRIVLSKSKGREFEPLQTCKINFHLMYSFAVRECIYIKI